VSACPCSPGGTREGLLPRPASSLEHHQSQAAILAAAAAAAAGLPIQVSLALEYNIWCLILSSRVIDMGAVL